MGAAQIHPIQEIVEQLQEEMANQPAAAGDSSQMMELIEELQNEVGAARPLAGERSAEGVMGC